MAKAHIIRSCRECDADFMFTKEEQDFHKEHGLPRPTTCPACRESDKLGKNVAQLVRGR